MNKICFGCGAKLQSEDFSKPGYIPESKKEVAEYCQRCFRMIHYGESKKSSKPKSTEAIINAVNKNAGFAVFMVDFIDIYDDVMNVYKDIKVPKVLVISKSDIIPKNVSYNTIKNYLRKIYRVREDIVFTSMKSNLNTFIKSLYNKDDVYFLGLTNSGKSTLINALAKELGAKVNTLTTSYKENTTLDFVRIKIGNRTFIDSPGFVQNGFEVDKNSTIMREIHPITYQNKTACTYKVGEAFKIRIKDNTNVVFYFSKHLKIERLYNKELIGVPFKVKGNSDIVISGLGFIKVTKDTEIILANEIVKYMNIRPSLTGGKDE